MYESLKHVMYPNEIMPGTIKLTSFIALDIGMSETMAANGGAAVGYSAEARLKCT